VPEGFLALEDAHAPLRSMSPQQCLLRMTSGFVYLFHQHLWMDNFYLRLHKSAQQQSPEDSEESPKIASMLYTVDSHTWLTNVTMQGDGDGDEDCFYCGFMAEGGHTHIEGVGQHLALLCSLKL
jgi:hypothetical protein